MKPPRWRAHCRSRNLVAQLSPDPRLTSVHGGKDAVVMPINAFLLAELLPNAQLIMYPDASHGAKSQHADVFLEHARLFLDS